MIQLRFHRFYEYCCNFICVRILESVYHFHASSCINYEGTHISCALVTELIKLYLKLGNLHRDILLERQLSTESDTYLQQCFCLEGTNSRIVFQILNYWINFGKCEYLILIYFGTISNIKKLINEHQFNNKTLEENRVKSRQFLLQYELGVGLSKITISMNMYQYVSHPL